MAGELIIGHQLDLRPVGAQPVGLLLGDGQTRPPLQVHDDGHGPGEPIGLDLAQGLLQGCLLYTSDAADE